MRPTQKLLLSIYQITYCITHETDSETATVTPIGLLSPCYIFQLKQESKLILLQKRIRVNCVIIWRLWTMSNC